MSTKLTARAQAVKAATDGKVLVVATADSAILEAEHVHKVLAGMEFREHHCGDCGTHVVASADSLPQPFCVVCSSDNLKASATSVHSHYTDDKYLAAFACGGCGQSNIVDSRLVKASGGSLACASCGAQLKVSAAAEDEEEVDAGAEDNFGGKKAPPFTKDDAEKARAAKGGKKAKAADEDKDDSDKDDSDKDDAEDKSKDEEPPKDDKEEGKKKAKASAAGNPWPFGQKVNADFLDGVDEVDDFLIPMEDDNSPDSLMVDTGSDLSFGSDLPDVGFNEPVLSTETFGGDDGMGFDAFDEHRDLPLDNGTVGQDQRVIPDNVMGFEGQTTYEDLPEIVSGSAILAACNLDDTDKGVHFVQAGSRLVAMKGHHAVATLSREAAGSNADVMFTEAFAQAVTASTQSKGLRKALKAFAFKPMCVPVLTKASLDEQVQKVSASAQATVQNREAAFAESLAITAVALGRNMLKGVENPLAAALQAELASAGVRNPVRRATALLASVGNDYARVLVQQAAALAAKPEAHREALAAALEMTRPQAAVNAPKSLTASGEEDGEDGDDDEDSEQNASAALVARFSRATASTSQQTPALFRSPTRMTASAGQEEANRVLSGHAPLSFGG